jgi:hypothetical protein
MTGRRKGAQRKSKPPGEVVRGARVKTAAAISAVAGILAGILGSWLAGQWLWGVAGGVLALTVVATGAEVIKAGAEEAGRRGGAADADPSGQRTEVNAVVGNITAANSTIAGRDITQTTEITNVTRRHQVSPAGLVSGLGVAALLVLVAGTGLLSRAPGGMFQQLTPQGAAPAAGQADANRPGANASPVASESISAGGSLPSVRYQFAATYHETNSDGDSVTQKVAFGSPMSASQLSAIGSTSQGACDSVSGQNLSANTAAEPASRDLAIPFSIASTDNADQQVSASVFLSLADFNNTDFNDAGGLIADIGYPLAVGESDDNWLCWAALWPGDGESVVVDPGTTVTFDGWLIFNGGISPDYPAGNPTELGDTFANLNQAEAGGTQVGGVQVTGPGVCVGESEDLGNLDESGSSNGPPFLHIGGPVASWEGCTGGYSGPAS